MIITVASGKGGTGKTTVAVSLALSLAADERLKHYPEPPLFLDCDVEEPNAALFLRPTIHERQEVGQLIPEADLQTCIFCGRCAQVCQYHAIAVVEDRVLVFPEICHGCGSCTLNCPTGAIHEVLDIMGTIERGWTTPGTRPGPRGAIAESDKAVGMGDVASPTLRGDADTEHPAEAHADVAPHPCGQRPSAEPFVRRSGQARAGVDLARPIEFAQGTMDVGQAMPVPIIRQLKRWVIPAAPLGPSLAQARPIILDAPPGTACPVVETMHGADAVLMVTEPTPFGLHDLRLAVEVARDQLGLPVGVVVNCDGVGDRGVDEYCAAEGLPILMRIPLERRIAEAYSEGIPLVEAVPTYRERFVTLWKRLEALR